MFKLSIKHLSPFIPIFKSCFAKVMTKFACSPSMGYYVKPPVGEKNVMRALDPVKNVLLYLFAADCHNTFSPKVSSREFKQLWLMAPNKTKQNQTFAVPVFCFCFCCCFFFSFGVRLGWGSTFMFTWHFGWWEARGIIYPSAS